MAAQGLHQELYLHRLGNLVRIQPVDDGAEDAPALTIELKSCQLGLSSGSVPLAAERGAQRIWGVIGLQTLLEGSALAVVTGAKKVAELRGHPVYAVTSTHIIAPEEGSADDDRFAELLRFAVDPAGAGKGLFFSYGADLTLSQQQWARVAGEAGAGGKPLHARADARFFFNRQIVRALLDAGAKLPGVERFALPLIMGSVQQLRSVAFGPEATASITLIARRSVQRPGTRHWRRGADAEGVVANFVETEQLVNLQTPQGESISSFVQVRGSIPLLWSQVPNIRYKPTTRLAPPAASQPAFDAHFTGLVEAYKEVVAVNLANQHGSEGVLSSAYSDNAARFAGRGSKGLRLVPFDFHKQCGATRYDRLALLWAEIRPDFERFGFYAEGAAGSNCQAGVFRVNCIDCLDRTNVVQGVLARHHLEYLLRSLGLMTDSGSLPNTFPKVEAQFKVIWANHGDDISLQYAGTGALKSGFTRTGVRTRAGMLDDGVKSGLRYYRNNFTDGTKQDALDLVTGAYVISKEKPSPFKGKDSHQPNPIMQLLVVVTGTLLGLSHLRAMVLGRSEASPLLLLQRVLAPFAISAGVVYYILKNGKRMVNRPLLRPDLTQPWS